MDPDPPVKMWGIRNPDVYTNVFPEIEIFKLFWWITILQSAIFGGVLRQQAAFTRAVIKQILSLYPKDKNHPKSVVLVSHSMGGIVAKSLFVDPSFKVSYEFIPAESFFGAWFQLFSGSTGSLVAPKHMYLLCHMVKVII